MRGPDEDAQRSYGQRAGELPYARGPGTRRPGGQALGGQVCRALPRLTE